MARVTGDFQSDVIRAFKGTLDFYYWRGIGVVRSWPRKPVLPRNPAVQAAGQDWRDNSRAISALPLELQILAAEEVRDTAYTWKDAWTTTAYGHGLDWQLANQRPPQDDRNLDIMKVTLSAQANNAAQTLAVNSAAFITSNSKSFWVPFSVTPFTHYRILLAGNSNAAGQSISLQVTDVATPTVPVHAPGPDLVIPNVGAVYDSGYLSIDNTPAADARWCIAYKGSNATVDLDVGLWEITFVII